MYYYAGTIRKLTKGLPTTEQLDQIIIDLKKKYTHLDVRYNLELKEKLNGNHNIHIHFMICTPKKIVRQMILSILPKGYNVWLDFVKSKRAWVAYITKQDQGDVRAQIDFFNEIPDPSDTCSYDSEETIEITSRIV